MIDPFAPECLQQLQRMVSESAHPSYLLIDGVFLPAIQPLLSGWSSSITDQHALFSDRANGNAETLAASPWLLPCADQDSAVNQLLTACDRLPAVTLIRSPSNIATLLARLKRWTVVNCDGMHFNFRYPDTRRLPGIHGVMTDQQRHALFDEDAWSYIGRDGRWHHLPTTPPSNATHPKAADGWGDPELTDTQFAALLADSEPDEQLAAVWQDLPDDAPARTTALPSQVHEWTACALAHADRLNIADMPERTRLCAWVLSGDPKTRLTTLMQQAEWPTSALEDDLLREGV